MRYLEVSEIFRKYKDVSKILVYLEIFISFFWLSPAFSSLFSRNTTQFYPRNNPGQRFPTPKIYSLEALKQQFSEMADAGNMEMPGSSPSTPTTCTSRKF